MLPEAAAEGKLTTRADKNQHKGRYTELVQDIHNTLEAVIESVNEAAAVLGEMSKGNLNTDITRDYRGVVMSCPSRRSCWICCPMMS